MIEIQVIADFLGVTIESNGTIEEALPITDPNFGATSFGWCSDKNVALLSELNAGYVLVSENVKGELNVDDSVHLLAVSNPRSAFAAVLERFFAPKKSYSEIASSASIHPTVSYDASQVWIGANVVLEKDCVLGSGVFIDHNTVIKSGTVIKNDVHIGSNCTIGGVGFGYEQNEEGQYSVIPHIGKVLIESNVEIGNNVCIDRAVMGSTQLCENVKVDNLVHIAHGVKIGRNSLIIANAMIAGSVEIGENVWVAPSSSLIQKISVSDNAVVGLGSVVVKDVLDGNTVVGVPARPIPKK